MSRPVSRILSGRRIAPPARATIHLGRPLLDASCNLPADIGRAARQRKHLFAERNDALLVLLPVGFTEPPRSPGALVSSYLTVSPSPAPRLRGDGAVGGLFSVALSRTSPWVAVSHHRCPVESGLSSTRPGGRAAAARPTHSRRRSYTPGHAPPPVRYACGAKGSSPQQLRRHTELRAHCGGPVQQATSVLRARCGGRDFRPDLSMTFPGRGLVIHGSSSRWTRGLFSWTHYS
jgi:hypothetical protein